MKITHRNIAVRAVFTIAMAIALCVFIATAPVMAETAQQPAFLKDLDIRQVPMKLDAAAPQNMTGTGSASGHMAINATFDRPDRIYKHGDSLSLTVEATEDAYIWVFDTGTSGKVLQIFPNQHETDNFLRAGTPLVIPSSDSKYQLIASRPTGQELITVVASKNNTPLSQELIDRETESAGPFLMLRGTAVSVSKDLSISLKKNHPNRAIHRDVFYITE